MSNQNIIEYNSRTAEKFVVRMPAGMRERIADVAKSNFRSSNGEIIQRLADSLASDDLRVGAGERVEGLSLDEQVLLDRFRAMGARQKAALVQLLAPEADEAEGAVTALAS